MRFRTSLRYRVILAFTLLGFLVSLGLAVILYVVTLEMEEQLIAETLSAELAEYIEDYRVNPGTPLPASSMISTFVSGPGTANAPAALQALGPGLHQLQLEGKDYYAEVRLHEQRRFIVLYDARQVQYRERQFRFLLGSGVLVITLVSGLLGSWLAGRVIAPVGELARRVAGLRPEGHVESLAQDFPRDEVGMLAREFDAHQQRLAAFVEREQAFTADVSHELRTPLAVIEGASELLLDDPGLEEHRRAPAERIARSAHEMSDLARALLLLAREDSPGDRDGGCDVAEILQQVVDSHRHMLRHKPVEIELLVNDRMTLPVECTLLRVVLANLVRNAIAYTGSGLVSISLDEQGVSVRDTGVGIPGEQVKRIFDHFYAGPAGGEGIGLSLVKRICSRYGWSVQVDSREGSGTLIQLALHPARPES